ncbi:LOB domain-containing protein 3-like [Zingiber officinale]|uniref:LOB domain-containing protein 3-like n=1 Tax=Zingiber officinale TaxID=94328 RepID=UPI001C4D9904|nr:LOB domain-containing protein 3-like [Zingiber officinale]
MAGPSLPFELCKDEVNDLDKIVLREPRGCFAEPPPTRSSPSFPTDVPDFTSAAALQATTAAAAPQSSDLDATSASAPPLPTQSVTSFPTMTEVPHLTSAAVLPCAACRFRHQKCTEDCLFAPFFPASEDGKFQKVRRLFKLSAIQEILESLLPHKRPVCMATIIYESEVHAACPNTGCLDIILWLHNEIDRKAAYLAFRRQHLSVVAPPRIGAGDVNEEAEAEEKSQ